MLDGYYNPGNRRHHGFRADSDERQRFRTYVDTTGTATFGPGQHIAAIQGVTGLTDEVALVTAGTVIAA